jgi:hypothetical protein
LDLTYLIKTKGILSKEYNTSIIDFDDMFFFEFNTLISQVEEDRERERTAQLNKLGMIT